MSEAKGVVLVESDKRLQLRQRISSDNIRRQFETDLGSHLSSALIARLSDINIAVSCGEYSKASTDEDAAGYAEMKVKSLWKFLKDSIVQWIEGDPFPLAAVLSYYTLFSLAPLLIIVIAVGGFAFGQEAAQNRIVETLQVDWPAERDIFPTSASNGETHRSAPGCLHCFLRTKNCSATPDDGMVGCVN